MGNYIKLQVFVLIVGFLLTISLTGAYATDLEDQDKALAVIAKFADKICTRVSSEDEKEELEVTGTINAELPGLLKNITDIGIKGAAVYEKGKSKRTVLEKDLVNAIMITDNCRLAVLSKLEGKLIPERRPVITGPLENYIRIPDAGIKGHNIWKLVNVGIEVCAQRCNADPLCKSFDYHKRDRRCYGQDVIADEVGGLDSYESKGDPYDYYQKIDCP